MLDEEGNEINYESSIEKDYHIHKISFKLAGRGDNYRLDEGLRHSQMDFI